MIVPAIKDWKDLIRQSYDNLTPGGWVEFQDLNFLVQCDDGTAGPDSFPMQWSAHMVEGAAKLGIDLTASKKMPNILADAGFVDIKVERFPWPVGKWPKDPNLKERGVWVAQNLNEGLQGFSMAIFTRGLGWRAEEVEVFLSDVRKDFAERRRHLYIWIWVVYARKPTS